MEFFPELAARHGRKADLPKKRPRRSKPQPPAPVVEIELDFIKDIEDLEGSGLGPPQPILPSDDDLIVLFAFDKVGTQR